MKSNILSLVSSVFFLFILTCAHSQDYDLIVTAKGDSIACRIDSINGTQIYFEMKSQNYWAQTHIALADVREYKRDAIQKKQFVFRSGTSIIESRVPAIPASIGDIQKNSVYAGIFSLSYGRMIPAGDRVGITFGGGLYHLDATGIVVESSVMVGGVKHYFESGIMAVYFFGSNSVPDQQEDDSVTCGVSIRVGYRYQGPGGLLLRAAPNFIYADKNFFVFPALSIGYSF